MIYSSLGLLQGHNKVKPMNSQGIIDLQIVQ